MPANQIAPGAPRYALITGGASGLGRALALALAREGWQLALVDVQADRLSSVAREVAAAGGTAEVLVGDVSRAENWTAWLEQLRSRWPRLDLLINNAGVASAGEVGQFALVDWQWVLGINLCGAIYGCHACRDWLLENPAGARIVNVASAAAFVAGPAMGAYNVTKAGVVALSETLYGELRGRSVGVTVAMPGFFATNLLANGRFFDPRQRASASRFMQQARMSAEQVAAAILRGSARGKLYVVVPLRARVLWRLRRLCPTTMLNLISWIYRRDRRTSAPVSCGTPLPAEPAEVGRR